jgi:hypothetical protein
MKGLFFMRVMATRVLLFTTTPGFQAAQTDESMAERDGES